MKKYYVDGPVGQIHCLEWGSDSSLTPILCLSPSPFSSKSYLTLAPLLAESRKVIAIDYPGYGNSDGVEGELTIEVLALAALAVADHCSPENAVDLFGFHSGTLVAVEMSIAAKERVNRMILTDVPFFSPQKQAELLANTPEVAPLASELSQFEKTWSFCVSSKLEHIPLTRAYQMFIDHISPGEGGNKVFRAAFTYPCEQRFNDVTRPTWVIATSSSLHEASCNTAAAISTSTLIEMPDITAAVLEAGAVDLAATTLDILA